MLNKDEHLIINEVDRSFKSCHLITDVVFQLYSYSNAHSHFNQSYSRWASLESIRIPIRLLSEIFASCLSYNMSFVVCATNPPLLRQYIGSTSNLYIGVLLYYISPLDIHCSVVQRSTHHWRVTVTLTLPALYFMHKWMDFARENRHRYSDYTEL